MIEPRQISEHESVTEVIKLRSNGVVEERNRFQSKYMRDYLTCVMVAILTITQLVSLIYKVQQ